MEIQSLLNLRQYYEINRQVGNTTTLIRGVENVENALVLVHSPKIQRFLNQNSKKNIETKSIEDPLCLVGVRKPVVIDNAAMSVLLNYTLQTIARLERENFELREKIK